MRNILLVCAAIFTLIGCGTVEETNSDLENTISGLKGDYKPGKLGANSFVVHTYNFVSPKGGLYNTLIYAGRQTLKPKSFKIEIGEGQMITVVNYVNDKFHNRLELWYDGEKLVGDEIFFRDGKESYGKLLKLKKNKKFKSNPMSGSDYRIVVTNKGHNKVKFKVEKIK